MARAQTLADLLEQRGALSCSELIQLFTSVLEDLEKAHAQGHLHGDVKPKKIVQVEDRVWRLIDYGVSRVGTARYIAPEKAQKQPVDARADLYSLGVVLYEAATGKPPFAAELGVDLIQAHINQPPPPPSSLKPDLPRELERIILRALEKDPARRFQSAHEFRIALTSLFPKQSEKQTPTPQKTEPVSAKQVKPQPAPQPTPAQLEETKPMAPPRPKPSTTVAPVVKPEVLSHTRNRPVPVAIIVILLITAAGIIYFVISNTGKVTVPGVIGMLQTEAQKSLEQTGLGFELGPDLDAPLPPGEVAEQNPKPGAKVKKGTRVQLRLSTGMIEIPVLSGRSRAEAERLLRSAGIDSIIFSNEYSDEVEFGRVINSEPRAGTRVSIKTPLRLRIANGRATCPQCGARREPGAQFCTRCGYRFPE